MSFMSNDELEKTLTMSQEILAEYARITSPELYENMECNSDYTKNPAIINVFELYQFFINKSKEYKERIKEFNDAADRVQIFGWYNIRFDEFDYETNYFTFKDSSDDKYSFLKKDGDLIFVSNVQGNGKFVHMFGTIVNEHYDYFLGCKDYYTQSAKVQPIHSIFSITISKEELTLSYGDFELKFDFNSDGYRYKCSSFKVMETLSGHEQELFKNIYIRIQDCPEWSQEGLYAFRKRNLEVKQQAAADNGKSLFKSLFGGNR